MDPLAHSLVGATLAETGLRRASPFAMITLVVGANLPDVDAVAMAFGSDTALLVRRGWTHGVVGLAVLPIAWVGLVVAFDRLVRRRRDPDAAPVRVGALLGLSYLAILTHPFLDWLNTYGVRVLMPFDTAWFYGDALFIIDPWIWLLTASAVVLAWSRRALGVSGWAILGIGTTALIVGVDRTPLVAKVVWLLGIGAIVVARATAGARPVPRLAIAALGLVAVYLVTIFAGNAVAQRETERWLQARGVDATVLMVGPVPARPFARDVIARDEEHYHFIELDWARDERFSISHPPVPVGSQDDPIVEAALHAPSVRGLRAWLRFPAFAVESTDTGHRVTIRDVRYARPQTERSTPLGKAVVDLDADLRPLGE